MQIIGSWPVRGQRRAARVAIAQHALDEVRTRAALDQRPRRGTPRLAIALVEELCECIVGWGGSGAGLGERPGCCGAHLLVAIDEPRLQQGALVLERLRLLLQQRYGIGHVTVQLETEHCDPGGIVICRPDGSSD